ncbi:hypothetical protein [Undibacterium sp. TJN19]|uniref:hypothetical protein n=1 Tax=Undibacterium sp. TJN19 TaxID=3413055 RepID=UPI003BF2BE3E
MQARDIFTGLFGQHDAGEYLGLNEGVALAVMAVTVIGVTYLKDMNLDKLFASMRSNVQALVLASCLAAIFVFSGTGQNAFLYFQF